MCRYVLILNTNSTQDRFIKKDFDFIKEHFICDVLPVCIQKSTRESCKPKRSITLQTSAAHHLNDNYIPLCQLQEGKIAALNVLTLMEAVSNAIDHVNAVDRQFDIYL